jgi:predicted AAA+ superfamily ATPase
MQRDMIDADTLERLLRPYNPWWKDDQEIPWKSQLPAYRRPIVDEIISDIKEIGQIISITGPRRVGKTTALQHVISELIDIGVPSDQILYFSFDDPEVFGSKEIQRIIFDRIVNYISSRLSKGTRAHVFFDEIQRLPRWELYLKKSYDLKLPIRFIVSGSASSPIFRKSQESLLGRIKDRHLLPFSFKEYCLYSFRDNPEFASMIKKYQDLRTTILDGDIGGIFQLINMANEDIKPFMDKINDAVITYCREGGFPEVWSLKDPIRKIEYLIEQQVRKVLYEDLMMLTSYRKPENVLRFLIYLLAHPGQEINMSKVAKELGVPRSIIEENLPRLFVTDLVFRIKKFTHQPLKVRQGNIKCYPIDLALRNAVLKTWDDFTSDPAMMGLYAENLVAINLNKWSEAIEISYYREKKNEVDFIVTFGGDKFLPIEVKHRREPQANAGLSHFMKKYQLNMGIVITREREVRLEANVLFIPLLYFLLFS